jgi:hypothetical protein
MDRRLLVSEFNVSKLLQIVHTEIRGEQWLSLNNFSLHI